MNVSRVGVNLPVYNGAATLARQLDSIVKQTFTDFTVFISDNGSEDETPAVCREYLSDPRFNYHRNHDNLGFDVNYKRGLYTASDSPYIIYASSNDFWEPAYLEKCVRALEGDPEAVLAYSHCWLVDEEGGERRYYQDSFDLKGLDAEGRFLAFLKNMDLCTAFYGLMRTEAVFKRENYLSGGGANADNMFLTALALDGPFVQIEEPLFVREKPRHAGLDLARRRTLAEDLNQDRIYRPSFPFLGHLLTTLGLVLSGPFDPETKNRLYFETVNILLIRSRRHMEEEIRIVLGNLLDHRLHTAFSGETAFEDGRYQYLDHFTLLNLADSLENARFFLLPEAPAGLHLARALTALGLGRTQEARLAAEEELKVKPNGPPNRRYLETAGQIARGLAPKNGEGE